MSSEAPLIGCVIYAAKSSEDRRGSIPDQLRECRSVIELDPGRVLVGDYVDEAFSAFTADRGPGLAEAMRHAEELVGSYAAAELWTQHSDRLARGDGRVARHAVEIALWALKQGVAIRTLQDPDTFRDLLYAVVVGQRNHEDSRRKSLATSAGHRRAAERGEYIGICPDGYRVKAYVSAHGKVTKRLVIDPDREPTIRLLFELAMRGLQPAQITTALNEAGHLTRPLRGKPAVAWTLSRVCGLLRSPRYAGLSTYKGQIVAPAKWPAYITEEQHRWIIGRIGASKPTKEPRVLEPYLLTKLARCGHCGSRLYAMTGHGRIDGTFLRRYVCASHARNYDPGRCPAAPIAAELVEAMFVDSFPSLMLEGSEPEPRGHDAETAGWTHSFEREAVLEVVHIGDDRQINEALQRLLLRMSPDATVAQQLAISQRAARQLAVTRRLESWLKAEQAGRTDATRRETVALNRLLRSWFESVAVAINDVNMEILATRKFALGQTGFNQAAVTVGLQAWARSAASSGRPFRPRHTWGRSEILGTLQGWADAHGRSPRFAEWRLADPYHPSGLTVCNHFGSWPEALLLAGLAPTFPQTVVASRTWTNDEIAGAFRDFMRANARAPRTREWKRSSEEHPAAETIRSHFGSWRAAVAAAEAL